MQLILFIINSRRNNVSDVDKSKSKKGAWGAPSHWLFRYSALQSNKNVNMTAY